MNAKAVAYHATTTITILELLVGGTTDLVRGRGMLVAGEPVVEVLRRLGYPPYLLNILGVWKLLGAVVLLAPGFPRLKEWTYAGTVFELTGAAASHMMRGKRVNDIITCLMLAAFALASWALRPSSRTLSDISPAAVDAQPTAIKAGNGA